MQKSKSISPPESVISKSLFKSSRTSAPKVRTGCITCKKRHVKCDEGKPSCGNCIRSRRHCEGYATQQIEKNASAGRMQLRWSSKQVVYAASPRKQLCLDQTSLDFKDDRSLQYFQDFVDLAQSPWIAAGSRTYFWRVMLPQLARNNSIVRHAAIGIGALSRWHNASKPADARSISVPDAVAADGDVHYFHGLAHYCHALKLQSQESASMQDALLLSILFLSFETLRGNRKSAIDHINHGTALLFALVTDPDSPRLIASLAPDPKPLLAVVADIFTNLASHSRVVLRDTIGRSPLLPNFAKALKKKNLSVESFLVLANEMSRTSTVGEHIPNSSSSLDEFEEYWSVASRSRTTIGPVVFEVVKESGVLHSGSPDDIGKLWHGFMTDERITEFFEASTRAMQALDSAFLPLFNRIIMCDSESPEYLRAIHLRLQYLGASVLENPLQYYDIERLHAHTPLFREYLSLAEIALRVAKRNLKDVAQQFSLLCSLSRHLLMVAFFCRDPLVRDEATWMLRDYSGQDGIWDTRAMYVLVLKNKLVERINATEGTPAEQWHRLWRREYLFEDCGERVVFCFLDKNPSTGNWDLVEEVAEVQGKLEEVCWKRRPLSAAGRLLLGDAMTLWQDAA